MNMYETMFWKNRADLLRIVGLLWGMAKRGGSETILRSLYREIALLLRPAEAAVRRLIVVLAAKITVTLKPARKGERNSTPSKPPAAECPQPDGFYGPKWPHFALADPPLQQPIWTDEPAEAVPFIFALPDKQVDATPLRKRINALLAALEDIEQEAQRLARWTALRERARQRGEFCTTSPLRLGLPLDLYGEAGRWLKKHELYEILKDCHHRAWWATTEVRDMIPVYLQRRNRPNDTS